MGGQRGPHLGFGLVRRQDRAPALPVGRFVDRGCDCIVRRRGGHIEQLSSSCEQARLVDGDGGQDEKRNEASREQ
jgi:hypothetical protein